MPLPRASCSVREFLLLERAEVPGVPEQWENRAFLFAPASTDAPARAPQ